MPFGDIVDKNFKKWSFQSNNTEVKFTDTQWQWLRVIKDHIASSLSITAEDLDLTPFDSMGGLGKYYELFGSEYQNIIDDLNKKLVA